MLRKPSSRSVTMPSSMAFCRTTSGGRLLGDQVAEGVGHVEQLVDALAALVAGVAAGRRSRAGGEFLVADFDGQKAELAEHDRARFVGTCGIPCRWCAGGAGRGRLPAWRQRGTARPPCRSSRVTAPAESLVCSVLEHEVAGERRLDGDLRRFLVAHFPDHDAVRILAQKGAQRAWRKSGRPLR